VNLCAFLNVISQKVIDPDYLKRLQNDVVQCLVSFELGPIYVFMREEASPHLYYRHAKGSQPV
jgi:hypothetical protein